MSSQMSKIAEVAERVLTLTQEPPNSLEKILRGLVGRVPLVALNYTTRAMDQELARLLDECDFDAVQVEGIHLAGYLPMLRAARSRPLLVCDWHNIESEVIRRYGDHAPGTLRRVAARALAWRLAEFEREVLGEFDVHIAVSQRDRERLLAIAPRARIAVVENGVEIERYAEVAGEERPGVARRRVLFVGSMDYHANVDAVVEFAAAAWPGILAARPEWVFTVVGRSPGPEVRALERLPSVEVTGSVDDVRPYYAEAIAAVVPLRIGGGSRLKILEAMAAAVPVVSTRLGAEGLAVVDGQHAVLTGSVREMEPALLRLDADPAARARIVEGGRALVQAKYDWSAVGDSLIEVYRRERRTRAVLDEAQGSS